ncbi:AP2-like ethylene-responsive transcription factor ANT-like [Hibiscus syriacus]|uniref:Growth-regulating factor n=1 Tax=Hibiscus syriacus TaxID=106335 RepID=A0A6A2XKW6_HIBSY|nr:growth-regulating factor 1-like [Hibiscus syriacus]KAE8676453.1 AP2-like ethylene-responsive transcription factor ANT-like [Hibiscus syriacus]
MDFGVVGLNEFVGSEVTATTTGFTSLASGPETKQKWYGSGFLKQERSGNNEDDWRSSKLAKFDDFSASKAMFLNERGTLPRSNTSIFYDGQQQQQQMLSFSAPKSEALSVDKGSLNVAFPYFHLSSPSYSRNTGYSSGGFNGANMHGVIAGARGPFTPSQWMELEHQALIYKYITSNVPIPSNLLIPIRKSLDSANFSIFSGGLLRPNTLGWGAFHLGFSNNTDPEPGRCRRTDGKKWRCSRDAVADQKYCERHMNRGRHRSRKPVEGQSGHSAAATTTKLMPTVSSSSASAVGPTSGSGESISLAIAQQQFKNLQPGSASNLSAAAPLNRLLLSKDTVGERIHDGLTMASLTDDLKSKENPFLILKQQISYEQNSRTEFGVVSSDSLLNPSHKSSTLIKCRNFGSSQDLTSHETETQYSLRQFMDEWPKTQSDRSAISWPEVDVQSDRTQLSISVPMAASDFMSSTSSTNNEKVTLSPLRLSREFDPIHMGLGVGSVMHESYQRQANGIPISWESSMGGPLGEVLHSTNSSGGECKNSSALNLMTEGWDNNPQLGSSPTGVLQKTTFGSLSNSSAGSSPRAENNETN